MNKLNIQLPPLTFKFASILLLLLLAAAGLLVQARAHANPADSPQLGFHIEQGDITHIKAARAAGAGFVVVVFGWDTIEPEPNIFYWEVPDAALRTAEFYGLEVIARLDRPPAWALDNSGPTPWRLEAYNAFVSRVAARYGERLAGLTLWNEPNLSLEWNNQPPDPEAYVDLLRGAYPAAKAAAPNVPVLLAGLAFTGSNNAQAVNDLDFLHAVYQAGGGNYFDIMAAHPYGFGRPPGEAPDPDRLNFRRLELHRQIMTEYGDGDKPVWITEMGWRTAAPNPADAWQVVTPQQQTDYVQQALDLAAGYPWLERLALWELAAGGDGYGYALWHGPDEISPAYIALVSNCQRLNLQCRTDPAAAPANATPPIEILAPDVIVRLGDRGTLHPHWVHLHRGGQNFSPNWQGDFFLSHQQAGQSYDLLLETMQVDQPTNRLFVNGAELATLRTRTRPDPTSTWVTQRFSVPEELLNPGPNRLEISSGLRNPARQYSFWRWENFQFRNLRLAAPDSQPDSRLPMTWQSRPNPSGWSETNRLRPGLDANDFWLTGNRPGELWRGLKPPGDTPSALENQAGNRPDLLFVDVLPLANGLLAATDRGLYVRPDHQSGWQAVEGAPAQYSYVVRQQADRYLAGFEAQGLWTATSPQGPWQPAGLANLTVLDLDFNPRSDALYAATSRGVHVQSRPDAEWQSLPSLPDSAGNVLKQFMSRLWVGQQGEVVVRNLDQLWRYPPPDDSPTVGWQPFGPEPLHSTNKLYTVLDCCQTGAIVGTNFAGLWRQSADGSWQRLDDSLFNRTDVTDLIRVGDTLYGAGIVALLESDNGGQTWQKVDGLPPVITDLLVDPAQPQRWLAGTPAGLYRSENAGRSWQPVSPPWSIWDMALGPAGRLFVARTQGLAYSDDFAAPRIDWQTGGGLEEVLFFSVIPHPSQPDIVAGGTWGNNLGLSRDDGQRIEPIHNGLETLSVLDVLWHPTPGQLTVGTIEGLFRTDNFGQSWFKLPGPLQRQTIHALLQIDDGRIWAGAADGLWSSPDYGVTWQQTGKLSSMTVLRLGHLALPGSQNQSWLWAGTEENGLWLSRDSGQNWQPAGLDDYSVYALLPDPTRPDYLIAATSAGIFETRLP